MLRLTQYKLPLLSTLRTLTMMYGIRCKLMGTRAHTAYRAVNALRLMSLCPMSHWRWLLVIFSRKHTFEIRALITEARSLCAWCVWHRHPCSKSIYAIKSVLWRGRDRVCFMGGCELVEFFVCSDSYLQRRASGNCASKWVLKVTRFRQVIWIFI